MQHHGSEYSIKLGFWNIQILGVHKCVLILFNYSCNILIFAVEQYGLNESLNVLMVYFEHYWSGVVSPRRFTVYDIGPIISSNHTMRHYCVEWVSIQRFMCFTVRYHASLLRRMDQHPVLYVFYSKIFKFNLKTFNFFSILFIICIF